MAQAERGAQAVRVVLTLTYPLPEDDGIREKFYGTADLAECIDIDLSNEPAEFILVATLEKAEVIGWVQQRAGDSRD